MKTETDDNSPGELVSVQVLRAIAALMVTIAHYHLEYIQVPGGIDFGYGAFGVDLFFVISGLIMVHTCQPLFGQRMAPINFFLRRLARIAPIYWIATAIFVIYVVCAQSLSMNNMSKDSVIASFFFIPWVRPSGDMSPALGVGWTLNFEMYFYAVFAFSLAFRRAIAIIFAAVIILGVVVLSKFTALGNPLLYWTNPIVVEFVFGMALAVLRFSGVRISKALSIAAILIGFGLSAYVMWTATHASPVNLLNLRGYFWGLSATLIVGGAVLAPWEFKGRVWRGMSKLGDASYALYLIHPLFITFVAAVRGQVYVYYAVLLPVKNWLFVGVLLVLSTAAALAIFTHFERPLTRRLSKIIDRQFPVNGRPAVRKMHA